MHCIFQIKNSQIETNWVISPTDKLGKRGNIKNKLRLNEIEGRVSERGRQSQGINKLNRNRSSKDERWTWRK